MSFSSLETTFSPRKIVFPKPSEVAVLPATKVTLEALLADTQSACEKACQEAYQVAVQSIRLQAHEYIIRMLEQATLARHRMFGASSEQLSAQSRLFDEAEVLAQLNPEAQDQAELIQQAIANDEGPLIHGGFCDQEQRSFDSTCKKLNRFLTAHAHSKDG